MANRRKKKKTANHATQAIIDAQEAEAARAKAEIAERLARVAPMARELRERFKQQRQEDYAHFRWAVDRVLAREMGLDVPRKKKRQKSAPVGAPPTYDVQAIRAVAEDVAKRGVPDKAAWFYEKVRDELTMRHVRVPGETRLKQLVAPIYKLAKGQRDAARKV